jgi:hypothetical protein
MDFVFLPLIVLFNPHYAVGNPQLLVGACIVAALWYGAWLLAVRLVRGVESAFEPPAPPRQKSIQELAEEEAWLRADARRLEALNEHAVHKAHAEDTRDFLKKRAGR